MTTKEQIAELIRLTKEARPPPYHAVTIPLTEYLELLGVQTRGEEHKEAAEKILNKIRKVSKSLGLFLSMVNSKIPLDTYFQSFNEAQDDIEFYTENDKVRLKIKNDIKQQVQQDSEGTSEHAEKVPSTV